jgi:hypothetical protein
MTTKAPEKRLKTAESATSLAQLAVSGSVIKTGDESIAIGGGGVAGGHCKWVKGADGFKQVFVHDDPPRLLSPAQALDRIGAAIRSNLSQLEFHSEKGCRESGDFFKLILIFAILGFLVLWMGVGLFIANFFIAGILACANAVVSAVTAAFFFQKYKERRVTIEEYRQEILASQLLLAKIEVGEMVKEEKARESLKKELIKFALGLNQVRQSSTTREAEKPLPEPTESNHSDDPLSKETRGELAKGGKLDQLHEE